MCLRYSKIMVGKILMIALIIPCAFSALPGFKEEEYGPPKPYSFGYKVHDKDGDQWRSEAMDDFGKVEGRYGYVDPHGMQREVHYVADNDGFRASVRTNEPGMDVPNPADVLMQADPPADYDAAIYGIEDLGPVYRSNPAASPVSNSFKSNMMESPVAKSHHASTSHAIRPNHVEAPIEHVSSAVKNEARGYYKYHRFAEPAIPPIYVVDGHLQSPWFPMEASVI